MTQTLFHWKSTDDEKLRQLAAGTRRFEDFSRVRKVIGFLRRQNPSQFKPLMARDRRIINLGCGGNIIAGYFNMDVEWMPGVDACWNITQPFPLADATIDGIFTEHCMEHLTRDDAGRLLKECRRILKPGRTMRIVVPDAELYARLYVDWLDGKDIRLPYAAAFSRESDFTPLMALNRVFRDHGHLQAYDFELLRELLVASGFERVRKVRYREGGAHDLLADSADRAPESLYVEATTGS